MQLRKGQIIELDIHALAFGGSGIGKHEGLTVFVEKTMPGDKIAAAFTQIKSNFARADLVKVIRPSEYRQKPRCPYFGTCGGCQLQFMPYEQQLKFKQQNVIDTFERIGKIYNPPIETIIGCKSGSEAEPFYDPSYYYRNKMEFSFGYDSEMNFALGMHLPGRRFDILDLKECYLQSEISVAILNAVRDFAIVHDWKPYRISTGEGFLQLLVIREGKRTNDLMVNLITSEEEPEDLEEGLKELVGVLTELAGKRDISIYWSKVISRHGQRKIIKEKLLYGKKTLEEKMILENGDELTFEIPPQAFFQINTLQAEVLYSQIVKIAQECGDSGIIGRGGVAGGVVFDLFCGTGTIGMFLAKQSEQVIGIELNEEAVKIARENARKNKIFNIDFYTGDVSKMMKNLRVHPSLIVIDPPRAGLTKKLISQIAGFDCRQLIYVSCNPATLARDCALFKEYGYGVKRVQPVDLFPHTFHIENVCLLTR